MARRNPKQRPTSMWDDAEEVPRAGIPSTDKLVRRQRRARVVVWGAVLLSPVLVISLFVMAGELKAAAREQPQPAEVNTQGRAAAMAAVTDWLDGDPAPLPGGQLLSWDAAQVLPKYAAGSADSATNPSAHATLEAHSLTVRDGGGATYTAQVLVATSDTGEVSVIGTPSLTPVPAASDWASALTPWPNAQPASAAKPVQTAVEAWVGAFTSGDPAMLRQVVGDPSQDHAYAALAGVTQAKHQIAAAAWILDDTGKPTTRMLVQAKVQLLWPDTATSQNGPKEATYDLLVEGADSAAPHVVAWGGPGTGPVLKAYGNAVIGRDLEATTPTPTRPTASPSPSKSATGSPQNEPAPDATSTGTTGAEG